MAHINLFALGGQDENGKNCYVLEHQADIFIINVGVKIPINSTNGVDALIPNFEYLTQRKNRIQGVFITNVKNDNFSAIPWLVMKIPNLKIYTSSYNKTIVINRLNKYNISPSQYKVIAFDKDLEFKNLKIQAIPVSGSIPGNLAFLFKLEFGSFLFMFNYVEGDLKYFGNLNYKNLLAKLDNKPLVGLITNAGQSNYPATAMSRLNLPDYIENVFKESIDSNYQIVVGSYDEEMVNLDQIINLCKKYNKKIVIYGRTYANLLNLLSKTNLEFGSSLPEILDHKTIKKHKDCVILFTGNLTRLYKRFQRVLDNEDAYLKLKSDHRVIMMAPPINGTESLYASLLDQIAKVTPYIWDVSDLELFRSNPTKEDLSNLLLALRPKYFLPVAGLYRYLIDSSNYLKDSAKQNKFNFDSLVLQNGAIARFEDDKLINSNAKIKEVGETIIDGFGVGDISSEIVSERETLGREGAIIINVLYSSKPNKPKMILDEIQIDFTGVTSEENFDDIKKLIKATIVKIISKEKFKSIKELNKRLRKSVRKKIFKTTDKDSVVALSFISV
ncbi:ribonuclease J [Mycoplasmopsis synoviae]|uniref:ribonuclease J n=1 Tax=Mycoplasmopsis synoviae TaxID=2109 RepID=UPI0035614DDC